MEKLIEEYYNEFVGLPNNKPIVRNNTINDAFEIVVFDVLYNDKIKIEFKKHNIDIISKYIVAPPDGGIDIFIEHEDGEEYYYDIIQVKYSDLDEVEIKQCLEGMKRTIKDYLKNPKLVTNNLKEVISNTSFDSTFKDNCTYYVVHKGELKFLKSLRKNEKIITVDDLKVLKNNINYDKVPFEKFQSDSFNNFIMYAPDSDERALLCNLRGYDLGNLSLKYSNTSIGRNILFGQNLRESLETKSKTYKDMKETIDNVPEKFWYYNNGITIIAEEFNALKVGEVDNLELKNFSIINGAQTTSALGTYLKNAIMDKEKDKEEQLKKVFVSTRILEINDPEFRDNIAIYNNMQNPITTRDMVSNRIEQKKLAKWLWEGDKPNIYVEIRRGAKKPSQPRIYPHQDITNEKLAQLAFAAFLKSPYLAKDKKKSLFNNDFTQDEFIINADYHKLFFYSEDTTKENGILFRKTKNEIDELLFVHCLYNEGKKYLKKLFNERIDKKELQFQKAETDDEKDNLTEDIKIYRKQIEINNICMFYCITLYYEFKTEFQDVDSNKLFLYDKYYADNTFKNNLIEDFAQLFLTKTIEIIKKESESTSNIGNWIKSSKSQPVFIKKLKDDLALNIKNENLLRDFISKYKA